MGDRPRNLRLLLVAYHFLPMNNGGVQRPLQMSKWLPQFGIDVSILTHSYHRTDLRAEPNVLRVYDTNRRGLGKLFHFPMRLLQRASRRLGMSTSWHGLWSRGVRRQAETIIDIVKPDVVMSSYPPVETLDIGLYLAEKFGVPLLADFRDGLLFEPVEEEMLRSRSTKSRYETLERAVLARAAGVLAVSEPISAYFRARYQHPAVLTMPNGFDPDEPWQAPTATELDPEKFNLVYTGRLGLSEKGRQGPAFLNAVSRLVRESKEVADTLRIHFIGEFAPEELSALSELVGLGVAIVHGFVDRPRSLGFQRAATVLLLIVATGKTSVATGKLFEYLHSGRPILGVTRNTAAARILRETGAGFLVDPLDADAIYETLKRLILEQGFVDSLQPIHREIEKYSRPHQIKELASFMKELVPASPRPLGARS